MRTAVAFLGMHAAASAALFIAMAFGSQAVSYYSAILFFVLNIPGVWVLKWLGAAPWLSAMGFGYGAPLTLLTTQVILGTAMYVFLRARRSLGA